MHTKEFWAGEGGDAYLQRNRVDWRARIPFWSRVIGLTGARSVLELGCNAGWNLSAIRRAYPDVQVYGNDVNLQAFVQAKTAGIEYGNMMTVNRHELVFTAGVLIHVPGDGLRDVMQMLIDASCHYVLAVEYEADEETEIEYRGQMGLLWKRPYGQLYQNMGLKLVEQWAPHEVHGFDRCTAWLLEKS